MTEAGLPQDGRARHWLVDAVLGSALALGAITMAHAARPEATTFTAAASQPAPAIRLVPAVSSGPTEPSALLTFISPVPNREVVSPFGLRQLPWEEHGRLHAGVDISGEPGEPVVAVADGVVTGAGHSSTYGRFVEIKHAEGLTSLYAHMGDIPGHIRPGLALKAGALVGQLGSTGTSTGPHLHLEIRDARDRPLNPQLFLGQTFAEASELPLRKAQRYGRTVRIAHVSMIPESKQALMKAKLEKEAAEKELAKLEKELKLAQKLGKAAVPPRAMSAEAAASNAAATESIEGLKEVGVGDDGRPRANSPYK